MSNKIKTGKDAVVIGNVSGDIGDGSVVIGATDERGNTIINQPMAVGRGAKAGPGSIAIGAGASAGSNLFHLIGQLKEIPGIRTDQTLLATIGALETELQKKEPQAGTIQSLWSVIQVSASVSGAVNLIQQIGTMLGL
jgi:hypothetical protein